MTSEMTAFQDSCKLFGGERVCALGDQVSTKCCTALIALAVRANEQLLLTDLGVFQHWQSVGIKGSLPQLAPTVREPIGGLGKGGCTLWRARQEDFAIVFLGPQMQFRGNERVNRPITPSSLM